MAEAIFSGFPAETFRFLAGLAEHNRKSWFERHREDYQAYVIAPAMAFVTALGRELKPSAPGLIAEPKVNGSIR